MVLVYDWQQVCWEAEVGNFLSHGARGHVCEWVEATLLTGGGALRLLTVVNVDWLIVF